MEKVVEMRSRASIAVIMTAVRHLESSKAEAWQGQGHVAISRGEKTNKFEIDVLHLF